MPIDKYEATVQSVSAPAASCFAITPNDAGDLEQVTRAIYVGVGGSLKIRTVASEQDVTFVGVAAGSILPIRAIAVRAAGTTASALVGLA